MMIGGIDLDDDFMKENMMGPNAVRILEEITGDLDLGKGMRVLDLGCGKGLTSIYLARKFGATVYATDLWIPATENFQRFKDRGLDDLIIPIHADAHDLPFADEFFDCIISVDSYHYFGHEEGFLDRHLAPLLKKGGIIKVGVPGLQREFENGVPPEMRAYIKLEYNFHSCSWWKDLWRRSDLISEVRTRDLKCHQRAWEDWLGCENEYAIADIPMIEAEGGKYFNTVLVEGIKK